MNSKLLANTGWAFCGKSGDEVVVLFGRDEMGRKNEAAAWAELQMLEKPVVNLGIIFVRDDEKAFRLPIQGHPTLLADRTGLLVVFEPDKHTNPDGSDVFPKPNNAAIYNADGSLRFQLKLPAGTIADRIGGVHSGGMPEKFKDMMGVVIATHPESYPEWVYAVDPNQPELIATRQWVRW